MKPSSLANQSNSETDNKATAASASLPEQKQANTLLAEGNVKKLFDESDMLIDWGALNPDSLWERPEAG